MTDHNMRLFVLVRLEDESGISGVGLIAEGVKFSSGKCILSWRTENYSIGIYDDILTMLKIHGHGGKTVLRFL